MVQFKKLNKKKHQESGTQQWGLSQFLVSVQHKVAGFLNRKTAAWSPQKVKLLLILFCLVSGNVCLYVTGRAILSDNGPPQMILKIRRLDIPAAISGKQLKQFRPKDTIEHH